ncbi:TPA: hypothetical protein EYP37_05940 [Candidatus Poribacteria bacterium]|nr:hypothetical protein [Candidatus Poribacteria bacterium]
MKEVKVDASSLKREEAEKLRELLGRMMRESLGLESRVEADSEGKLSFSWETDIPRPYFRLLLKKFLHRSGLKERYRVISDRKAGYLLRRLKTK